MVLNDGSSTSSHGQNIRNLQNDIFWCRPPTQCTSQSNTYHLHALHVAIVIVWLIVGAFTLGHLSSQGRLAMTSTASAPPTPIHTPPSPPAQLEVRFNTCSTQIECCVCVCVLKLFYTYLHWVYGCLFQSGGGRETHSSQEQSEKHTHTKIHYVMTMSLKTSVYYLVDDASSRFPEPHSVLGGSRGQEVVHLTIGILSSITRGTYVNML